jgi:hypothetical protein
MRRILAGAAALLLAIGSVAYGHDHREPRATLRIDGQVREGWAYHADGWARKSRDPGFCEATFATGFAKFRKALRHDPGDEIVVRFHKKAMPYEIEAHRWPRVDDNGFAAGTPTPVPWALRPYVVGGSVRAWELVILPPVVDGHLYLGVGAWWADEDGCSQTPDLGSQYAAWTFHVVGD